MVDTSLEFLDPFAEWRRAADVAASANRELAELEATRKQMNSDWDVRQGQLLAMLESAQATLTRLEDWTPKDIQVDHG